MHCSVSWELLDVIVFWGNSVDHDRYVCQKVTKEILDQLFVRGDLTSRQHYLFIFLYVVLKKYRIPWTTCNYVLSTKHLTFPVVSGARIIDHQTCSRWNILSELRNFGTRWAHHKFGSRKHRKFSICSSWVSSKITFLHLKTSRFDNCQAQCSFFAELLNRGRSKRTSSFWLSPTTKTS